MKKMQVSMKSAECKYPLGVNSLLQDSVAVPRQQDDHRRCRVFIALRFASHFQL
jgi:hypothetical protein